MRKSTAITALAFGAGLFRVAASATGVNYGLQHASNAVQLPKTYVLRQMASPGIIDIGSSAAVASSPAGVGSSAAVPGPVKLYSTMQQAAQDQRAPPVAVLRHTPRQLALPASVPASGPTGLLLAVGIAALLLFVVRQKHQVQAPPAPDKKD